MTNLIFLIVALALSPSSVSAQPAATGGTAPDLKGLCIKPNEDDNSVERGLCKAIFETIGANRAEETKKGCTDELFEKLYSAYSKDEGSDFYPCGKKDGKKASREEFQDDFVAWVSAFPEVLTAWKSPEEGKERGVFLLTAATAKSAKCGCEGIDENPATLAQNNTNSKCGTALILAALTEKPKPNQTSKTLMEKLSPLFGNRLDIKGDTPNKMVDAIRKKQSDYCDAKYKGGVQQLNNQLEEDGRTTVK